MKVAITTAVHNEQKHISSLLEKILCQSHIPDEIIIVDDGSVDDTAKIIKDYSSKYPVIRYLYQNRKGPAAARNLAWKNSDSDICIFTDGDCEPEKDWIKEITAPFGNKDVGAAAGGYRTINEESILARFIGHEIAWKYKDIKGEIKAHGTYNLAVKKSVLEEIGGLDEGYPFPSGEDWDMTYKISKRYKIIFVPSAIVGHYHPDKFWPYFKNQIRRGFDRVKLYRDHPDMAKSDNYTGEIIKYQVLASGLFIPSLVLIYPLFKFSFLVPLALFAFLLSTSFLSFPYIAKRDLKAALYGVVVQMARNFAWFIGLLKGVFYEVRKTKME